MEVFANHSVGHSSSSSSLLIGTAFIAVVATIYIVAKVRSK
jgi:hypothetical protein